MIKPVLFRTALWMWLLAAPVVAAEPVSVPLDDASRWEALEFRKIPANDVFFAADGLVLGINASASPLVHALDQPLRVTRVRVRGRWSGALAVPPGATQGDKGADDFVLKLGLVESGDQTLNWFQRKIAAPWIRTLFGLAPKGSGVNRIHFLSTTQQPNLVQSARTHPLSDLLYETRVTLLEAPGEFEMDVTLPEAVDVLALWISSDGDDTGSSFMLHVEDITLE